MPPGSLPPPFLQPPPSCPGFCPYSPSSPSSPLLGGGLCRLWPCGIRLLPGIRKLFPPRRNCAPIALKLLSPSLSPAGTARHPSPGQRVRGPVQSCPPLCPQQGWPARAYSRCSVKIGQMVNSRDRRWGGAWERERTVHSCVCHLVPTSSGNEGCSVQKVSRELTLRCPNL